MGLLPAPLPWLPAGYFTLLLHLVRLLFMLCDSGAHALCSLALLRSTPTLPLCAGILLRAAAVPRA